MLTAPRQRRRIRQLELCDRGMFGDLVLTCQTSPSIPVPQPIPLVVNGNVPFFRRSASHEESQPWKTDSDRRRASALLDQLLSDIYSKYDGNNSDYNSGTSSKSRNGCRIDEESLRDKNVEELQILIDFLQDRVLREGRSNLLRQLKRRDALRRQREAHYDFISDCLRKLAPESQEMRFSIEPVPGESGFSQWVTAMKMVAQLPGGIPPEFRRRLWLQLADRFLVSKGVDWSRVERSCFSEWSHPADAELGVQIVKDLHRTGCSLFCGEDGQENQPLLKRVLLAYARWNKTVGYCQGFNMLAALILQVTDKNESDALKLMIYLIEGVLPDSYFADSLRGLSVDMAVFRELLKSKLPRLSKHLDTLQAAAKEGTTSYEPPLMNVFTMQWFLTLFCNCLPQPTVLRVWDLILLEGNEILLRTALAIWQTLADRILAVRSADEFYCIMGVLTREMLEFGLVEPNSLIKAVVSIGPLTELKVLRDHYLYNINPWGPTFTQHNFGHENKQLKLYPKEKLMLDISALKKQYAKLKQRQRQAHIIFSAAVSRQVPPAAPVAMNHLLLGKSALVPTKRLGPPKGAVPPVRHTPSTLHWKDTDRPPSSSSSSSDTELCDEPDEQSSDEDSKLRSCQLPDDDASDKNIDLMISDNIVGENGATATVLDSKPFNQSVGDIFDTACTSDTAEIINFGHYDDISVVVQSEDDFDFDRFLEDRVRCLKQNSPCGSEKSQEEDDEANKQYKTACGRRNSQRALEIIQENSLILHRILQCQSRLTSPPPTNAENDIMPDHAIENQSADYCEGSSLSPNNDIVNTELETVTDNTNTSLIHSENVNTLADMEIKEPDLYSESDSFIKFELPDATSTDDIIKDTRADVVIKPPIYEDDQKDSNFGSKYSSILEYSKNLNEKYNTLILNSPVSNISKTLDCVGGESSGDLDSSKSNPVESAKLTKCELEANKDTSEVKSPNRVYNPFPVKLSSRQNKDVAVRLGLYKK